MSRERDAKREHGEAGRSPLSRADALSAIQTGQVYLESDSYSDAIGCFERAAEAPSRSDLEASELSALYAGLARCYVGLGEHGEARRWVDALRELHADDAMSAAEADVILGRIESRAGRFRESLAAAQRAYNVLREGPESELLADASKIMGTAHSELGSNTAARDCFVDCLVTNRRLGNAAGVAGAYNNLGILAKRTGDLESAVEYFKEALDIDSRLGRPAAIARRFNNLGVALYRLSRWDEAQAQLERALAMYRGMGATRDIVSVESALGSVFRARREWDKAREHLERALATSRSHGFRRSEALALEFLGELEADRGHHEEALELLDSALASAYQLSANNDAVSEVLRRRAEVLLAVGRLDEAERDCAQSLELSGRLGDRLEEGAALRVLAGILYARGDKSGARERILGAEEALRRTGESFELARTSLTAGIGLTESSSPDELPIERVEARLFAAEELFARIGARFWVGRSRLERAKALRKVGEQGRAREWLERARESFELAGERAAIDDATELLREIDAELAGAGIAPPGRYSVIADGYRLLYETNVTADTLHELASRVADSVTADRLVLFETGSDGALSVATSFDRSGSRLAEARRIVRSVTSGGRGRKTVVIAGADAPDGLASSAVFPVEPRSRGESGYALYADRREGPEPGVFESDDVEFLASAARMLALLHRERGQESAVVDADVSEARTAEFVTRDPGMLDILSNVERLRGSDIPILILGESGVGKDVLARTIHDRRGRFVALNSGAVPVNLQESELFGHVKGAFTDADRDREGLVAAASGGTLFLDEIGEMSTELQVKLLRFLQSGEYRRVGESVVRTSGARVISASNRDLREESRSGRFRSDLFYRLSTFVIEIPPLRARPQDIPLLMEHFLELYCGLEGKAVRGFSSDVRELFLRYDWSENNVRELENEVRRGIALCDDGGMVEVEHLRPELRMLRDSMLRELGRVGDDFVSLRDEVEALERRRIAQALTRSGSSKRRAALDLGLSRTGLYTKLRKYGMD
ncbi:MAG: sigma 54-interacting transcriptional regulator [Candidatus Eisenbacteria bacterium]